VPFYSILDLLRFTGTNAPTLTTGKSDYFSIDSGTTALGFFNDPTQILDGGSTAQGGDVADWASSGTHAVLGDSFDAFLTTGTTALISNLDTIALAHIGLQQACYRKGTLIQTTHGEQRIETLSLGDELATLNGGSSRVIWLGKRTIDLKRHPEPWLAWPVRIRAGAFGPELPKRDLYLSPDHAVWSKGVLIPIKLLINDSTIRQVRAKSVVYHHVELEQHDVILAEGLPAETYMDAGDRNKFSGEMVTMLHPDFSARHWEMTGCAPLVLTGPKLVSARRRLARRAKTYFGTLVAKEFAARRATPRPVRRIA